MKSKRHLLDDRISTSRLRRPFPFAAPAPNVTAFFERVAGMSSIFVGNACNQRCIYCDTPRDPASTLTPDDARRRVDLMANMGLTRLMFLGGEPTIWRHLPALIEYARDRGFADVWIATNGLMLSYDRYVQRLRDAGLTAVQLSVDDFDPATLRQLSANAQADVLLGQALANLLARPETYVVLNAVVTAVNRAHLPAYVDHLAELSRRRGAPIPAVLSHLKPITFAYENRATLVEPITVAAASILDAVQQGLGLGLPILHKGLPPCVTPGFEAYGWEANLEEYCRELDAELPSVQSPMLAKRPACASCRWDPICPGVYANYVELHGWDEFRPVTGGTP